MLWFVQEVSRLHLIHSSSIESLLIPQFWCSVCISKVPQSSQKCCSAQNPSLKCLQHFGDKSLFPYAAVNSCIVPACLSNVTTVFHSTSFPFSLFSLVPNDCQNLCDSLVTLKLFSGALSVAGIWVMADVVANHMGCEMNKCITSLDVSSLWPFNRPEHYHNCAGGSLPDLITVL